MRRVVNIETFVDAFVGKLMEMNEKNDPFSLEKFTESLLQECSEIRILTSMPFMLEENLISFTIAVPSTHKIDDRIEIQPRTANIKLQI